MLTVLTAAVLLAAGYLLGRWQPGHRAANWARWQFLGTSRPTRRHARWWAAQAVFAVECVVLLATRPRATLYAWRHRHDPPPRSPALVMDPDWAKRRATTDTDTTETP